MLTMEFFHLFLLAACVGYLFFRMGQVKAYRDMNNVLDKMTEFAEEIEKDKERILRALTIVELLSEAVGKQTDKTK